MTINLNTYASTFTRMVLRRFVCLVACLLFLVSLFSNPFGAGSANASTEEETGMPNGTVLVQYTSANRVMIGMLSSFSTSSSTASAAMHTNDVNKGGKTTVLNGRGDQDTSMFVVDAKSTGKIGTTASGGGQHAVIDRYFSLPQSAISMLDQPVTSANVANYTSGKEVRVSYPRDKAGKAAVIRLELGKASAMTSFNVYPCGESPANRAALFSSKAKVQSTMMFADTGSGAAICIKGSANVAGLKVETYGYANWNLGAPKVLSNMMQDQRKASVNEVVTLNTGTPNKIALLQVSANSASKGHVEIYTTQKGNKGNKILYLEGGSKDTVMVPIYTGTDGRISLKSNVSTGYNVTLAGSLTSAEAGISLANYAGPKKLEDTRDGYPGKGLLLLNSSGQYIKPYQIISMRCTYADAGYPNGWKYIRFKVNGLDPERPGGPAREEGFDQGMVGVYISDFQIPANQRGSWDTFRANDKGVAQTIYTKGSDSYSFGLKQFIGEVELSRYNSFWYLSQNEVAGKAKYHLSTTCTKD